MTEVVDEQTLRDRTAACERVLSELGRVVVAFSAGVDSTLLLSLAARTLGAANVLAAIGVSPSLAQAELESGRKLARQIGVRLVEVPTGEMDDPNYTANPSRRCFYCKSDLFGRLEAVRAAEGFAAVVSGANADDAGDFRPGLEAGRKLGVRNPLMDAGLTKADIRELSRRAGLPTWDKPAMACLASRVPYGETITAERLGRVEKSEQFLRDAGFRACRVRDHGQVARIEVPSESLAAVIARRLTVVENLKALGYVYVTLDLQGLRTGSMNEAL